MAVVTITRQFGAGGSDVARLAAAALGWTVIDNDLVDAVAREVGMPAAAVAAREERAPSLRERLVKALAASSPEVLVPSADIVGPEADEEKIVRVTERIISEAATAGRVVLVGRGAQAVLSEKGRSDALHAYVVAGRDTRAAEVARRLGITPDAALKRIDETDAQRDRYVHKYYARARQEPSNYHLVLNTGFLGYEGAADQIVAAVKRQGWA